MQIARSRDHSVEPIVSPPAPDAPVLPFDPPLGPAPRRTGGLADPSGHRSSIESASIDPLTRLTNRAGFTILGAHTLRVCNRLGRPVLLLSLDVAITDPNANHLFGVPDDEAIVRFADILLDTFPDGDVIGRIGDEQFGVLVSGVRHSDFVSTVCQLRHAIERHNEAARTEPRLVYDAGSAIGDPSCVVDFDQLLCAARRAMRPQIGVHQAAQTASGAQARSHSRRVS